jgi:hypothetical protein
VQLPRVEENALRGRRFTGIDMSRDTDIAIFVQTYGTGHKASQRPPLDGNLVGESNLGTSRVPPIAVPSGYQR